MVAAAVIGLIGSVMAAVLPVLLRGDEPAANVNVDVNATINATINPTITVVPTATVVVPTAAPTVTVTVPTADPPSLPTADPQRPDWWPATVNVPLGFVVQVRSAPSTRPPPWSSVCRTPGSCASTAPCTATT